MPTAQCEETIAGLKGLQIPQALRDSSVMVDLAYMDNGGAWSIWPGLAHVVRDVAKLSCAPQLQSSSGVEAKERIRIRSESVRVDDKQLLERRKEPKDGNRDTNKLSPGDLPEARQY